MDREVSTVVELSVALIAISIVIGIISFTVFMGQDMSNDVAVESSKIVSAMEVGELEEMRHQNNIMPTALKKKIEGSPLIALMRKEQEEQQMLDLLEQIIGAV